MRTMIIVVSLIVLAGCAGSGPRESSAALLAPQPAAW